ncbi:MAG: Smr/MutS family protein [Rubrivivax sp.]|nr:Smr/MutS family protein [Rubrivivax sp.]
MKARSLADLGALRDSLVQQRAQAEAAARLERERRAAEERERRVFADAVGPVTKVQAHPRPPRVPPQPVPHQRQRDERAVLAEAMQGVDPATLLRTDDALGFRRPEVGEEVLVRLRSGHWAIQGEIDLHGLRRDEAREQLAAFLRLAQRRGQRCLRVVHGKGNGSPGREPVLKGKVHRWLSQHAGVLAFAQAGANDGGAGALIVLLGDAAAP